MKMIDDGNRGKALTKVVKGVEFKTAGMSGSDELVAKGVVAITDGVGTHDIYFLAHIHFHTRTLGS